MKEPVDRGSDAIKAYRRGVYLPSLRATEGSAAIHGHKQWIAASAFAFSQLR